MKRFVEGEDRVQSTLFPERLDEYISEENPVRVIEAFIDELDLKVLGFEGIEPRTTGGPAYHPLVLLKFYYGYLNRIQSSRRLERETQQHSGLLWHRLSKSLADPPKNANQCDRRQGLNYTGDDLYQEAPAFSWFLHNLGQKSTFWRAAIGPGPLV